MQWGTLAHVRPARSTAAGILCRGTPGVNRTAGSQIDERRI